MRERLHFWFNFHEDGPWAWWWHCIRSGCVFGHKWELEPETEEAGGVVYTIGYLRICQRCGQFGGFGE